MMATLSIISGLLRIIDYDPNQVRMYNLYIREYPGQISETVFLNFKGAHRRYLKTRYGSYRNQVGMGLSYRPASLCSLATQFQTRFLESIPHPIEGLKISAQKSISKNRFQGTDSASLCSLNPQIRVRYIAKPPIIMPANIVPVFKNTYSPITCVLLQYSLRAFCAIQLEGGDDAMPASNDVPATCALLYSTLVNPLDTQSAGEQAGIRCFSTARNASGPQEVHSMAAQ
jgi:hypothetical protein